VRVGDGAEKCTQVVEEFPTNYKGRDLVLVDTPGFDDIELSDTEVLEMISAWLKKR
jgi:predicted GTPase